MSPEALHDDGASWSSLIGAVAGGDRSAFARLFEYFAPRIKTFMRRSGVDDGQAEELAQEVMVAVWRNAARFNPGTSGGAAWIFTIARNLRIDALRRKGKSTVLEAMAELHAEASAPPDATVFLGQIERRVKAALERLPFEQCQVVRLSFYDERAHGEIAAALGIPLGTVKSRLRLAMARLRALLDECR